MVDKLKVKGKIVDKHPYISGPINLSKAIQQFRSSLPPKIDAPVLKKLGIAPKNESYLINILRFLKLVDEEGTPTPEARKVFTQHDNAAFGDQLSQIMKKAYSDLFSLHGDKTWELDTDALITYFRESNQTSSVVGYRQAITFQTLAAFAGHGEVPGARSNAPRKQKMAGTNIKSKTEKNKRCHLHQTLLKIKSSILD
jgi:hypothetical protein